MEKYKESPSIDGSGIFTRFKITEILGEYHDVIMKFKKIIWEFNKAVSLFNKIYILLFRHQVFVANSLILLHQHKFTATNIIGYGMADYYQKIASKLYNKLKEIHKYKGSSEFEFLKKIYADYFILIGIVANFLEVIGKTFSLFRNEKHKYVFKMINDAVIYSPLMKKCIFMFNLVRDIFDAYYSVFAPRTAVYLRINDFAAGGKEKPSGDQITFAIDIKNKNKLSPERLKTLGDDNLERILSNINFKEIYDSNENSGGQALAANMGISAQIKSGQSIIIVTYGYSGVGKTWTLVGTSDSTGVLQNAIIGIKGGGKFYARVYELYGNALPYKGYWTDKNFENYDHKVFCYTNLTGDGPIEFEPIELSNINGFLNNDDDIGKFVNLTEADVNNFSETVDEIDKIRKREGRIKPTKNNPESSRSIMFYEFILFISGDDGSEQKRRFVIIDLPGKEDLVKTYVKPFVNVSGQVVRDESNRFCSNFKGDFDKYGRLLRSAFYVNPMMLAFFKDVRDIILNRDYLGKYGDKPMFYITVQKNNIGTKTLIQKKIKDYTYRGNNAKDGNGGKTKQLYADIVKSIEILRYMMNEPDGINDLKKILEQILENRTTSGTDCININAHAIGLEGIYINENIAGLMKVLLNNYYQTSLAMREENEREERLKKILQFMEDMFLNMFLVDYNDNSFDSIQKIEGSRREDITEATVGSIRKRAIKLSELSEEEKSLPFFKFMTSRLQALFVKEVINTMRMPLTDDKEKLRTYLRSKNFIFSEGEPEKLTVNNRTIMKPFIYIQPDETKLKDYGEAIKTHLKTKGIIIPKKNGVDIPDREFVQYIFEEMYDFSKIYSNEPPIKKFIQHYLEKDMFFYLLFVVSNNRQNEIAKEQAYLLSLFAKVIREFYKDNPKSKK